MREFRPGRFEILPPVIKNLIIINGLIFLTQLLFQQKNSSFIEDTFALHTWQSSLFRPWQFITHMFLHGGWTHILLNMFALWMFGSVLENLWGPKRFLTFYLVSGLGAALAHMGVLYFENQHLIDQYNAISSGPGDHLQQLYNFIQQYNTRDDSTLSLRSAGIILNDHLNEATLGASGAVFGCLAAFGYLFPNTYLYIYFFLPLKAKYFVILYIASELFATIQSSAGDNVAHVAHLGGALVGFLLVYFWNKTNRRTFY